MMKLTFLSIQTPNNFINIKTLNRNDKQQQKRTSPYLSHSRTTFLYLGGEHHHAIMFFFFLNKNVKIYNIRKYSKIIFYLTYYYLYL